ncbi:MAG: ABC transporter permease [Firmicutes bacterium HGW-Firmicutes-11]|jgi:NitT/TauT family transport system permease protein|nr:MAG: ABC transporter permease [Firmicutes bacterium HGW-Firmicutes-11]
MIVIALWYLLHLAVRSPIVPGPWETTVTFFKLMTGNLLLHIGVSLYRILVAVMLSVIVGLPLGIYIGWSKRADKYLSPVVYLLYPIPKIAFLPVFLVLFGLGDASKIILIITIIFFQILLAARDGIKEITKEMVDSARSLGLGGRMLFFDLILPAVMPKMISALRISIGIGIAALFFAENYATRYGIGYFIMNSWVMVDYVAMFAGVMALSLLGILLFRLLDLLERKFCPWLFLDNS